jgi:hypothetical protein
VAAVLGDLLQLVDNQSYLGQQVLNVYYYRVTATLGLADPYLADLNSYWEDNVLDPIIQIQGDGLVHQSREWRNISNGTDLFVESTAVPGANSVAESSELPSYVSLGFLLQRESLATRNGYKRFAGLTENFVEGNTWTGSTTSIDNIETALAGDLNIGILAVAEPVIVKRPIVVPVGSYIYSSIGAASFRGLGTQNTRKAGRGV